MSLEELRPIGKQPVGQLVYRELLEAIVTGVLRPGVRLPENDVAQRLGVSATPVREALKALERDELVVRQPYHTSYVRVFSPEELRELYEARMALESMAIRLAARRIREEELAMLDATQREGQRVLEAGSFPDYLQYNARFHNIVLQASGNRTLARLMQTIAHRVRLLATITAGVQGQPHKAVAEHEEMIDALRRRDEALAAALMERHIQQAADLIIPEYERYLERTQPRQPGAAGELEGWVPRWLGRGGGNSQGDGEPFTAEPAAPPGRPDPQR